MRTSANILGRDGVYTLRLDYKEDAVLAVFEDSKGVSWSLVLTIEQCQDVVRRLRMPTDREYRPWAVIYFVKEGKLKPFTIAAARAEILAQEFMECMTLALKLGELQMKLVMSAENES